MILREKRAAKTRKCNKCYFDILIFFFSKEFKISNNAIKRLISLQENPKNEANGKNSNRNCLKNDLVDHRNKSKQCAGFQKYSHTVLGCTKNSVEGQFVVMALVGGLIDSFVVACGKNIILF